ncbi:MAG: hypothetical protein JZU50_15780 [Desulfobulbaceae bacterium]|nr:hypothetical protein [Desulfobulbaceae bacterium]
MLSRGYKPGVPRAVHLFAAPFLWTVIGCMLMARGWSWLDPGRGRLLMLAAGCLGTLKSWLILDKVSRRSIQRLVHFKDGTCLGAVYSWKTWLLVGLMMTVGFALRCVTQPGPYIGTIYCAIGWSLCFSSRLGWQEWYKLFKNNELT